MVAFEAVGFANAKIDNLIVGWFAGPVALGFYAKAYEILLLATSQISLPIGNVVHATLSRVQDDASRFRESLARFVLLSTSISLPLVAFIAAHAPLVIVVLFGEKWLPSAAIFRALTPGALAMTISTSVGWIFVSLGRAHRQLPWALVSSAVTVMAFFIGAQWGALGVAIALSACRVVLLIPTLVFTCHGSPVGWFSIVRAAARPMAASAIAVLVSSGVARFLPVGFWSLSLLTCVFGACYVACWIGQPGGVLLIRQQLKFARVRYGHA
jgi:PST family polysaccharide transporter